jgi:hypothetical protein
MAVSVRTAAVPSGSSAHDGILPTTRWLALFILPFLVVAAVILWLWPEQTGKLFAWPIQPRLTAMLLATAYIGGIYFFTRVARSQQWHRVKVGFWPVATFASLLGVATVLHWDRFSHAHVAFWTWAALYFVAPPLVLAARLSNRRRDPRVPEPGDPAIPAEARLLIGAVGLAVGALGLVLFVTPGVLVPDWPWKITPLTARVVAAILAMQGVTFAGIALDRRWSAARVMFEAELVTVPLIVVAVLRAHTDFQAGAWPSALSFAGGLGGLWLAMLAFATFMDARGRALGGAAGEKR